MEGHKNLDYEVKYYENKNIFVQVSEGGIKKDFTHPNHNAIFYLKRISSGRFITLNLIKRTIR